MTAGVAVLSRPFLNGKVGVGIDYFRVFGVVGTSAELAQESPRPVPGPQGVVRFPVSMAVKLQFTPDILRQDLRNEVAAEIRNSFTQAGDWLGTLDADAQAVWVYGPHCLLLRGRTLLRTGDVRFFDESPLAGSHLRAFFGGRYWVRESLQAEVAGRAAVWQDSLYVGGFADASLFGDRSRGGVRPSLAYAVGPSFHFLMFDRFACDLYYGFGFAPVGFSHNFSFEFQTIF